MNASRQEVSETLEAAVELLTAIRLSQSVCQRLQNLAHGDGYAEAHAICLHLHQIRQETERLQVSLDTTLGQAESVADLAPPPKSAPKRAKTTRNRPSH
ncbi:MAG: hypothetical protein AB1697_08055 [Pseudomonadota bacterium]